MKQDLSKTLNPLGKLFVYKQTSMEIAEKNQVLLEVKGHFVC